MLLSIYIVGQLNPTLTGPKKYREPVSFLFKVSVKLAFTAILITTTGDLKDVPTPVLRVQIHTPTDTDFHPPPPCPPHPQRRSSLLMWLSYTPLLPPRRRSLYHFSTSLRSPLVHLGQPRDRVSEAEDRQLERSVRAPVQMARRR